MTDTSILEEAAFRAWFVKYSEGDPIEVARSVWRASHYRAEWLDIARAVLAYAAEIAHREIISAGDAEFVTKFQRGHNDACQRIADKLAGDQP